MKNKKKVILLVLSTSVILTGVGFSSFVIPQTTITGTYSTTNNISEAVAYISGSSTYYSTVEKAIEVANQTTSGTVNVFVIAGTRYTLTRSVTINSNVVLNLPYEGETYDGYYGAATTTEALKDPDTYLTTQLVLAEGVTLTNYGTIYVGGILGSAGGGSEPGGQTCSYYCEILCEGVKDTNGEYTPQILNYGTIDNRGSIAGSNDNVFGLANYSGSTLYTPFVVCENRGGSAFAKLAGLNISVDDFSDLWDLIASLGDLLLNNLEFECSPMLRIYFPNTSTKAISYHGATIICLANLYGNDTDNQTQINMFGSTSSYFIQSYENSYIITQSNIIEETLTYNVIASKTKTYTSYDQLDIDLYGDFSINSFEMELMGLVTVSTEDLFFPATYTMDISFNSLSDDTTNVVYCNQDVKIMPGGSLEIGENVSFYCGDIAVYEEFNDTTTLSNQYPNEGLEPGYLEVNGILYVDNLGGYVSSTNESAVLFIDESINVSSKEIYGDPTNAEYETYELTATGNINGVEDSTFSADTYYTYNGSTWEVLNIGVTLDPESYTFSSNSGGTTTITATITPANAEVTDVSWTISSSNYGSVSWDSTNPLTATLTASTNYNVFSARTFTVTFSCKVNGTEVSATSTITVPKMPTCVVEGTEILMGDGSTKIVDDIRAGDIVKVFNHWTGKLENAEVALNDHIGESESKADVLTLTFDNGVSVGVAFEHGFYSVKERKYVYLDAYNYKQYIGEEFYYVDQKTLEIKKATLIKGEVETKVMNYYSPVTKKHLNVLVNGFLSMAAAITGWFNIFENDENLMIIRDKFYQDIETYGLFTYEDLKDCVNEEAFINFNFKYFKVSIGKGLMTLEQLKGLIETYKQYLKW